MERARTELLRSFGYDKAGANRESFQFVVYGSEVQYKKPAFLDDELRVTALIKKASAASILFEQSVWREATLLCQATIKIACVDGASLKPMPIPPDMAEDLKLKLLSN